MKKAAHKARAPLAIPKKKNPHGRVSQLSIIALILLTITLVSCQTKEQSNLLTLDIEGGLAKQKELPLSKIADRITYVKLETNSECLIGNGRVLVREEKVFIMEVQPPVIHVFNLQGEFLHKIDKQGKGPGEYMGMFQWSVNPSGTHIAFTDLVYVDFYLYTAEGKYLNNTMPPVQWNSGLFFTSETDVMIATVQELNKPDCPLVLHYTNNLNNCDTILTKTWMGVDAREMPFPGVPILCYQYDRKMYFREQANDTLFQVDLDGQITPRLVFNTGGKLITQDALFANDIHDHYRLNSFCETDQYLSFTVWYKKKFTLLYYDKKKDELFSLPDIYTHYGRKDQIADLKNDLDGFDYPWSKIDQGPKIWTSIHQAIDLKELEESGIFETEEVLTTQHGKELAKLVKESKLDDNPIIRICHLRL